MAYVTVEPYVEELQRALLACGSRDVPRLLGTDASHAPDILEVIAGLPPGTMGKADMDVRIKAERSEWDHRG